MSTFDVAPSTPAQYDITTGGGANGGGGFYGAWTNITPPSPWANAGDPDVFSDPTLSPLSARLLPGGGDAGIRGILLISPADLVTAMSTSGGVSLAGLIPSDYRPAVIQGQVVGSAQIITDFGSFDFLEVTVQVQVLANGTLHLAFGTLMADGATSFPTFLGGLPGGDSAVLLILTGTYPLT